MLMLIVGSGLYTVGVTLPIFGNGCSFKMRLARFGRRSGKRHFAAIVQSL